MDLQRLFIFLLCGTTIVAAAKTGNADILAEESFSHPDGDLVGQTPTPGPGSAWIAHDDEGSHPVPVSDGKAILTQFRGGGGREDVSLPFGAQASDALLFARFDFTLPSGQSLTDEANPLDDFGLYFAHFKSDLPTTGFRARTGVIVAPGGGDFGLAINADGSRLNEGVAWPNDLSFDTTYRAVVSWDATSGESKLWLDPVDEASANISDIKGSVGTIIEAFALRQSNDYNGSQVIDNLVVATTFAEALAGTNMGGLPGDYNNSGTVENADLTLLLNNWAASVPPTPAGWSGAPLTAPAVDNDELTALLNNWGTSIGTGSVASEVVPEPISRLLAAIGLIFLGGVRIPFAVRTVS